MVSQKKRSDALLLTETILALSDTQKILNQSAEHRHLILPGLNSTTRIAETGKRGDPCPCMNATWEPELRCRACQTIAQVGMESLAGRTRAAWTRAKETSGKIIQFYSKYAVSSASLKESAHDFVLNLSSLNTGLTRGPIRMRTERSGGDGPGPSARGGPSSSRGRSNFSDRDGKPMTMNNQVSSRPINRLWCIYNL